MPRNDKVDCTVSVALGHGSKDQQMAHLSQMLSFAGQANAGWFKYCKRAKYV